MPLTNPNVVAVSASDQTFQGTVRITGGPNITVGTDASGASISGAAGGGGAFSGGVSTIGNTLGNTGTVSKQLVLAGGNRITLSQSTDAGGATVTVSAPNAQSGISGIVGSDATYTTGTVTFTGVGGGITVSSNTGQRIDLSVAAPVAQTGTQFSAGISGGNTSNASGTVAGRVVLAGGNNVTLSGSTNGASESITISAFNQSVQTQNFVALAATNTTYTSGTVVLTGSHMVTVNSSANNQTVIIDATQSVQTQNAVDVTLAGNSTSGGAGYALVSSGTMTLAGGPNITLSQDGNHVSISGGAGAAGGFKLAEWQNFPLQDAATVVNLTNQSTLPVFWPEILPGSATLNSVGLHISAITTGTLQSFTVQFGVYTFVNSTSAALLGSVSQSYVWSTASSASWSGQRDLVLTSPSTQTAISNLTPGNYLFGLNFSAGASQSINLALYGAQSTSVAPLGILMPGANQASTGVSQGMKALMGIYLAGSTALPSNVGTGDLENQKTAPAGNNPLQPWIWIAS